MAVIDIIKEKAKADRRRSAGTATKGTGAESLQKSGKHDSHGSAALPGSA